jgi:hypothetical protein
MRVIRSLDRCSSDRYDRARLREQLTRGPWCWPENGDEVHLEYLRELGLTMPRLTPGAFPLVTVCGSTTTLWAIHAGDSGSAIDDQTMALGPTAWAAWEHAQHALPRSLPILCRSVREMARSRPSVHHIASWICEGSASIERAIDGPSAGLAFAMVLASLALRRALPDDAIASAAVDANGRLDGVEHLSLKIEGVVNLAPRLRRIVVATEQAGEATRYADGRITVVGATSVADALEQLLGPGLADALLDAADDRDGRAEMVRSFFRLAVAGRDAAIDWTPVEEGARYAARRWANDLAPEQTFLLRFAEAVAARHQDNAARQHGARGVMPDPPGEWFDAQPVGVRVAIVAHMVQHAADTAIPDAAVAEQWSTAFVPARLADAYPAQLRLLGALARLRALTGRAGDALALQQQLAAVLFDSFEHQATSHQVSEWYRLAGACRDGDAFDRAQVFDASVESVGGYGGDGPYYVRLARAKGALLLGREAPGEVVDDLRKLADGRAPDHVRLSARRWLMRALAASPEQALVQRDALVAASTDPRAGIDARKQLALLRIDESLTANDASGAAAGLDELRAEDPGPVTLLERAARGTPAEFVARFYPY